MDWVRDFYSTTGTWWGAAEARVTERDHRRVARLHAYAGGDAPLRVLELGSGYGTTAVAAARAGHAVTAVEITDRARHGADLAADVAPGTLTLVQDDFYAVRLAGRFDAVCYWNGFGIGSDADQRRLLARIAGEWLEPHGVALIDVYNPFVWARWDGDQEHRLPDPERGYAHELREETGFDPVTCTASDTWWDVTAPERRITQTLRCYTPADLRLLLEGTGLALDEVALDDPRALLTEAYEYVAVLRPDTPPVTPAAGAASAR
jgi:SAM-dependent methyltransferase